MKFLKTLLILIFSLCLFACGKKAPPLPIEKSIPQKPTLEIEATYLGFNLWITLPDKTTGGFPLNKIKALLVEKEEIPVETQGIASKKIIKLKPKLHSAGRILLYTDTDLKERFCYIYRLKIEKDFLVSTPFTEGKRACWKSPPEPPKELSLYRDREGNIILQWLPPERDLRGAPLTGKIYYKIIKYSDNTITFYDIINSPFIDSTKSFKTCYRIQTVLEFHETPISGPLSRLICIE